MGASNSSRHNVTPPKEIGDFRKLGHSDHYDFPELPQKRKPTDSMFILILAGVIAVFLPFLLYTLIQSDVMRLTSGYDKCGNVCGKKNDKIEGIACSGLDNSKFGYLKMKLSSYYSAQHPELLNDKCVEKCDDNYEEIVNRCIPSDKERVVMRDNSLRQLADEIVSDIKKSTGSILAIVCFGIISCAVMLLLFRYYTRIVVWVMLIGTLFGFIVASCAFWYFSSNVNSTADQYTMQTFAIIFTICTVVLVAMLLFLMKKINLVIRLMEESIKVVFKVPLIFGEPLLTFIAEVILLTYFIYTMVILGTAGDLTRTGADYYEYEPNIVELFTWFYNIFLFIWLSQFIQGCQHIVISGAVSSAYFSGDNGVLSSPIYNSFYNLCQFHLGTVAFGSLILTIVAVIKALIRSLINNRYLRVAVDLCLGYIEEFLKYLSKNAYIMTAIHGQPFYTSGKRAVNLLAANAITAVAINSIGDFVLGMAKLLIVFASVLFGILIYDSEIHHFWAAIVIGAIITTVFADCVFSVFETAIDTIFLCFCEDSCMNDGVTNPYFMSVNLMKYMDDAKTIYKEKK